MTVQRLMTSVGSSESSGGEDVERGGHKPRHGCRREAWIAIAHFHPGWFSATMGTGIVAIILQTLPYPFPGHHQLAIAVFVLNVALFVLFLAMSIARYTLWPSKLRAVLSTPAAAMPLGTFPMGLASLVSLTALICAPAWGPGAAIAAWVLWWIDVVLSVAVCLYVPFLLTAATPTSSSSSSSSPASAAASAVSLDGVTTQWLLPVVAPIVASAAGAVVAHALPDPRHALITCIVGYVLWGIGVPFALLILGIYYHRLAMNGLVSREQIVSTVIPLGPLGQGGYVMLQLGAVARKVFPELGFGPPIGGDVLYIVGALVALVLWGFAWLWLWFAVATMARARFRFPFNLGWWAYIFPMGVLTTTTNLLGTEFDSAFFKGLGSALALITVMLWLMVFSCSVWKAITREIFTPYDTK